VHWPCPNHTATWGWSWAHPSPCLPASWVSWVSTSWAEWPLRRASFDTQVGCVLRLEYVSHTELVNSELARHVLGEKFEVAYMYTMLLVIISPLMTYFSIMGKMAHSVVVTCFLTVVICRSVL
jgi:hypothetical protein